MMNHSHIENQVKYSAGSELSCLATHKVPTYVVSGANSMEKISKLTNKDLHKLAQEYGGNARKWQRAFAALLPEIEKRKMYKERGMNTIYEYAAKLCGMSKLTVDDILWTHSKIQDKPILVELMMEQGWSKLKLIANVATVETQEFWAEKVRQMSRETLGAFVHELRKQDDLKKLESKLHAIDERHDKAAVEAKAAVQGNSDATIFGTMENFVKNPNAEPAQNTQSALFTYFENVDSASTGESTPAGVSQKAAITFRLDEVTEVRLRVFKQKLEKGTHEPQDWNKVINELLDRAEREAEISKCNRKFKKIPLEAEVAETTNSGGSAKRESHGEMAKRYILANVLHILESRYKGKCAYPGCLKPAEIKHHTLRFSLNPDHNPDFIAPLCKNHERLAHLGLIKYEELSPDLWQVQLEPDKTVPKYAIDLKVNGFRKVWSGGVNDLVE